MITLSKKSSFSEKLASIKGLFRDVYDQADVLSSEMQEDIDKKTQQIESLSESINATKALQSSTREFMSNLEKFI